MRNRIKINDTLYEAVGNDYYRDLIMASMENHEDNRSVTNYKNGYLVSLTRSFGSYNGGLVRYS